MSSRIELLALLNAMEIEIEMAEVDPEESLLGDQPKVIEHLKQAISVVQRLYPLVQIVDELITSDISPKLFLKKWKQVQSQFDAYSEIDAEDIGDEVKGLLGKFGNEGESA